jgi:hypothetical protein
MPFMYVLFDELKQAIKVNVASFSQMGEGLRLRGRQEGSRLRGKWTNCEST